MLDIYELRKIRVLKQFEGITECDILSLRRATYDIKCKYGININKEVVNNFINDSEYFKIEDGLISSDNLTTMCIKRLKELEVMKDYNYINDYETWLDMLTLSDIILFELLPLQILLEMEYKYDTIGISDQEEYIAFDYLRTLASYYLQITQSFISMNKNIAVIYNKKRDFK